MNGSDIFDFVYMFLVGAVLGLMWWRLVWAIRRGDKWELMAEFNRLKWIALDRETYELVKELAKAKKLRDELRENIDLDEKEDEYVRMEQEPLF